MNHLQFFVASLIYPKQLAATRALSIGKVMQYAFILILLLTVFSFSEFIGGIDSEVLNSDELEEYLADIKWLINPFAFLLIFLMMSALTFLRISIYAAVGLLFARLLKRRGEYRQIWRTATYTITWATILSIVAELFEWSGALFTQLGILISVVFLYIAISSYPKLKK